MIAGGDAIAAVRGMSGAPLDADSVIAACAAIIAAYEAGATIRQAAADLGISNNAARRILITASPALRSPALAVPEDHAHTPERDRPLTRPG
ncbi:MAG TPA: hypothetical protein VMV07_17935 [Streptosporangiaceae bacterium]|nr:hypothetical protein [Streptosporangiaceae bacterium]